MAFDPSSLKSGRVLLCRHGETDFNATFRFQGQEDIPLNEVGQEQARLLRGRLAEEEVDLVFTSDLKRARATALTAMEGRHIEVVVDPRIREMAFGRWEGLTFAEIQDRFPDDVEKRRLDRMGFVIPDGGESLLAMCGRLDGFLGDVLPRHEGKSVLLVSHGGTTNGIISVLLGLPMSSWWRLRNQNANLSVIRFTPEGPRLAVFNETEHLRELKRVRHPVGL
jgi:broad specificity phosphatase PhoE